MRPLTPGLTLAGIAALLLVACGGGGGSSSSSGGGTNTAPVANAGANQTVSAGVTVTLNGTASSDADGTIASYTWAQTAGAPVVLANGTTSQPTFPAPSVLAAATLSFSLVVTDNLGATSTISTVNVTVNPPVVGNVNLTGRVTFARVPFATSVQDLDRGLNYAGPVQQPARGVIVRAIDANTLTVLATGTTTDLGDYALTVVGNLNITMRVEARMLRDAAQPLPRWDVSVRDGVGSAPYQYTEPGSFNSSAGGAHNVAIPTGISAAGVATGTRASGPFAVLDTVYQGIQTILGVAPTANFDALVIDWGTQANGTFFESGPIQRMALVSNLAMDTDEFDQHVIAHEFGHYIEFNFSRADNIGGGHSVGDKLDPRVAFGEGFGYAFAAIVLNDPVARDSGTDNGNPYSTAFNVETNPQTIPSGGCWCSESSVWSILWDLFDTVADANDSVALGFQPIWDVLIGAQRTTPAFTTIFPFITALKAARPGDAAAINTLVAAQNIDASVMDAYASNETHAPPSVPTIAALPLYEVATVAGPAIVLRTVDDAGTAADRYNKLGARRFVRFSLATTRPLLTITASSSSPTAPDPDFLVFRNGDFVRAATGPPATSETTTINNAPAGEYVVEVYECGNGCVSPDDGTPGDYNLTVTIN
jgi:hypothetical protein